MSIPNNIQADSRYATPSQVDSKIATQAVTDAGQYGVSPGNGTDLIEGADFQSDGHSFGVVNYNGTNQPRSTWFQRVATRNFSSSFTNNNVSGRAAPEAAGTAVASAPAAYRGVILWDCSTNDASRADTVAGTNAGFQAGLFTYLHTRRAAARYEAETYATESGSWSTVTDSYASNGSVRQTTTQGSKQTYNVAGSRYWFFILGGGVNATSMATAVIDVDGTTVSTTPLGGIYANTGNSGSRTWFPYVVTVSLPDTGSHSIGITKSDSSSGPLYVDALCLQAVVPPLIILHKGVYTTASGAATNANINLYNGFIDTVAASVASDGTIITVDSTSNFIPGIHTIDGLHPNNYGAALIASNIQKVIRGISSATGSLIRSGVNYNGSNTSLANVTYPVPANAVVNDSFTRADSSTALGNANSGQAWVAARGTWGISNNTAYCISRGDNQAAIINSAVTDQKVMCTMTTLGSNGTAIIARSDASASTYYMLYAYASAGQVTKTVSGTTTVLGTLGSISISDGARFELDVIGTQITAKINGVTKLTVTDNSITTGGYAGIRQSGSSAAYWDDFSVS